MWPLTYILYRFGTFKKCCMNLNTTTAMLDYAWLLWLNLVALCLCSRLESGFFTKHSTDGARLSNRYTIENTGSILSCCSYCLRESSCLSVSFEDISGTCELFNNTYADHSFTTEDGWVSYMKDGKCTLSLSLSLSLSL